MFAHKFHLILICAIFQSYIVYCQWELCPPELEEKVMKKVDAIYQVFFRARNFQPEILRCDVIFGVDDNIKLELQIAPKQTCIVSLKHVNRDNGHIHFNSSSCSFPIPSPK